MQWYSAKIIYRIICGNGNHTAQFDEQLKLVMAADPGEAFAKATGMGATGADTFYNQNLQLVRWEFIAVSELNLLGPLEDGAELGSRIQEVENADAFITFVHHKASELQRSHPVYQTQTDWQPHH